MNMKKNPAPLFFALGLLGCAVRFGIYAAAVDEKGLLIPSHPLQWALWALTAVTAAAAVLLCGSGPRKSRNLRLEIPGELLAALGIGLTAVTGLKSAATPLDGIQLALCVISALGLFLAAFSRRQGKAVHVLCYAAPCLFYAVYMVCRYRFWSSHPQIQDWFFPAVGAICAMIFAYLRCVPGKLRLRAAVAVVGCFCCLTALANARDPWLYLGSACWMITNLHAPGEAL